MIDLTFATAHAYNYRTPDNELILSFEMHEVAGEPGTFRFVAYGYRAATGAFHRIYADIIVDAYGVRDVRALLTRLFAAADACIRDTYVCFDVFYNLTDGDGSVWHPMNYVGRNMLAAAYERESVNCYPLTVNDVKRLAASIAY